MDQREPRRLVAGIYMQINSDASSVLIKHSRKLKDNSHLHQHHPHLSQRSTPKVLCILRSVSLTVKDNKEHVEHENSPCRPLTMLMYKARRSYKARSQASPKILALACTSLPSNNRKLKGSRGVSLSEIKADLEGLHGRMAI
jgi:hypothetical protein